MNRFIIILGVILAGCSPKKTETDMPSTNDSKLQVYTISNKNGMSIKVTNFGGRIMTLLAPDKNGKMDDVVLGYDTVEQYLTGNPYFGAEIGRYGNRIAKGKFTLDGKEYQLATNNGVNSLHGGPLGFHNVYWQVTPTKKDQAEALELVYNSPDGEEGFPGNLKVKVTYSLTDQNELVLEYVATTDKPTVINLTHHSFFNLAGAGNGNILNHELTINSNKFTPVDLALIPTGELMSVLGTPFDFQAPHTIGERINMPDLQLKFGNGYDHNWVLDKMPEEYGHAATVFEPVSGRIMEVWTTEPGLQFYSGNFLDKTEKGKGNKVYDFRAGFCLETQHFPDSPNNQGTPNWPLVVLRPGEIYTQKTSYKFSAGDKFPGM